ncbi:MAG: T9SS type A sorting domain-containing protein [Bacteroidales bacterium]|jgi:hypothetical protein|nr:T9SS type A sorting domain-containing protein [Bacteroidales bacterium]
MKKIFFIAVLAAAVIRTAAQVECTPDLKVNGGSSSMTPRSTRTVCHLHGLWDHFQPVAVNTVGSRTDKQVNDPTGFFHVRKIDGRWWIIDPEGYYFIHKGVTSIRPGSTPLQTANFHKKWGTDMAAWTDDVKALLKQYDFTGIGGFSDEVNFAATGTDPMPYTLICNFMSGYRSRRATLHPEWGKYSISGAAVYVFDEEWEDFCEEHAQTFAKYAADKNLLGFFSDNEQYFQTNTTDMLKEYLQFPDGDPCKDSTVVWLRKRLNLTGGEPVPAYSTLPEEVLNEFLFYAGRRYYKYVSQALKKYCPNHMYIGSRNFTKERTNEWFMKSQQGYVDIMTVNYYNVWTPETGQLYNWEQWTDAPLIVSEFYTKAMDTGLPNTDGAGWKVPTQTDRGLFYQNYALALLQSKSCVGWHWFRYQDNDVSPGANDNGDANKGIVDNNFEPYRETLEYMKEVNTNVYNIIDYFDRQPTGGPDDGIIIPAEADANFQMETNKGNDPEILIKNYPTTMREGYLRFDLSNVTEPVQSAKIILTKTRTKVVQRPYEAMIIDDDSWSETGLVMSNAPTVGAVLRTWTEHTGYDTLSFNVTARATEALATDEKISLRIRSLQQEGGDEVILRFAARENSNAVARPRLVINGSETTDEGIPKTILINGLYLKGFSADAHAYTVKMSDLSQTPTVTAIAENAASIVDIVQAANTASPTPADRTATVTFTSSADPTKTATYSLLFEEETIPAPTHLRTENITVSSFDILWDIATEAFKYKLYVYDSDNHPLPAYNGTIVTGSKATVSGLTDGETYTVAVQSVRSALLSPLSEICSVGTVSLRTTTCSPVDITGSSFVARWREVTGADEYALYVYNARDVSLPEYYHLSVADTFQTVTGLHPGEKYSYSVKTIVDEFISGFSNTTEVYTQIAAPVALQALPVGSRSFTANWNPVPGADCYLLLITGADNVPLEGYNWLQLTVTMKEITGLEPHHTYKYRVKAQKDNYTTDPSDEITVTTLVETGTEDIDAKKITFYPNPVADHFYVTAEWKGTVNLTVINSAGTTVMHTSFSSSPYLVHVRELPSGIYFVVLEQSGKRESFKIVKE